MLLSAIFLFSGVDKINHPEFNQTYMAEFGVPWPGLFLIIAILFELPGGLSILLGCKARWGAIALALYFIPVTLIFHSHFDDPTQAAMFMRNLAMLGGLLLIAYFGPGPVSLDKS